MSYNSQSSQIIAQLSEVCTDVKHLLEQVEMLAADSKETNTRLTTLEAVTNLKAQRRDKWFNVLFDNWPSAINVLILMVTFVIVHKVW